MKKRNLAAMGLAGVMAVGMCMPVMAAEIHETGDQASNVKIEMTRAAKYVVEIPADISGTVGIDGTLTFSIHDAILEEGHKINVSTDSATVALKTSGNKEYSVTLKDGNTNIDPTSIISLSADDAASASGSATKNITVNGDASAKYAGTYSETVTFTVADTTITP